MPKDKKGELAVAAVAGAGQAGTSKEAKGKKRQRRERRSPSISSKIFDSSGSGGNSTTTVVVKYSRWHTRANRAMYAHEEDSQKVSALNDSRVCPLSRVCLRPHLMKQLGPPASYLEVALHDGLKLLAERHRNLKKPAALAARAMRETEKLYWALPPTVDEDDALQAIASSGFDHARALVSRLHAQLPDDVSDKHISKAFRKAIARVKAGTLEPSLLEEATLTALRERRLA